MHLRLAAVLLPALLAQAAENPPAFPSDPLQDLERTCFQTGQGWSANGNLRSDVSIVYGIDPGLPSRIETWRCSVSEGKRARLMGPAGVGRTNDGMIGVSV